MGTSGRVDGHDREAVIEIEWRNMKAQFDSPLYLLAYTELLEHHSKHFFDIPSLASAGDLG